MAESLRRLVNIGSFAILQEKSEKWLDDYLVNTCDQNVSRACEIIELNARLQGQLFKLLTLSAHEGGVYGGASVIKARLLPWLGQGVLAASASPYPLDSLAETAAKDRELNEMSTMYERSIHALENDLQESQVNCDHLQNELLDTKDELQASKRLSTSDKMFTEQEVRDLRIKLRAAEDEIVVLQTRSNLVDNYERQIRCLREDVAILSGRKDVMLNGPIANGVEVYRSLSRPSSPLAVNDITQRVRQQNLIARFNDMFAQDRLDTLDILRSYSDDHENNQRIIFVIVQEAFTTAKFAFASYKLKVRGSLASTHYGPDTLEEAVQDYINRNADLYDLPALVGDVNRALKRSPRLYIPTDELYSTVQQFVREACRLAWNMSTLAYPLDVALATDAELIDDIKYRRSYDSEFTAPLVNHHVWPCLMQGVNVIVKGEACTRRGAALSPSQRSRSRSRSASPSMRARSVSPIRSLSPTRAPSSRSLRTRSPSPRRPDSYTSGRSLSPGYHY